VIAAAVSLKKSDWFCCSKAAIALAILFLLSRKKEIVKAKLRGTILYSAKPLPSVTLSKFFIVKGFFAEYFFSNTRQKLCRVSKSTHQKKHSPN
jgi:hypothetical protein